MIPQVLMTGHGSPLLACDSADFDGTNDDMARADLTGAVDSKKGIFSCFVRFDGGDGAVQVLMGGHDGVLYGPLVRRNSSNKFACVGQRSDGLILHNTTSVTSYTASSTWHHVLGSWDCGIPDARLIIDDNETITSTPTDGSVDNTKNIWVISQTIAGQRINGCIAELYFAPDQYLDFSLAVNRRKFISATGKPVWLGATGSLPTGTAPLIYQHLDRGEAVANFATNRGTGGDWTITGTLDTGSTSPSD